MSMTGIKIPQVRYKGSLPAINDLIAGHVPMMFCDVPSAAGAIRGGKVRALGVTTKSRLPGFPDIPPSRRPACRVRGRGAADDHGAGQDPDAGGAEAAHRVNAILSLPEVREQMEDERDPHGQLHRRHGARS